MPPLHESFASFIGAMKPPRIPMSGEPGATNDDSALLKDLTAAGFAIPPELLT